MTALVIARSAATKQSSAPRVGRLDAAVAMLEFLAGAAGAGGVAGGPGPRGTGAGGARAAAVGAVAGAGAALGAGRRDPPAGRAGGALLGHRLLWLAAGHRIDRLRLPPPRGKRQAPGGGRAPVG